jgi:hypothetical protein
VSLETDHGRASLEWDGRELHKTCSPCIPCSVWIAEGGALPELIRPVRSSVPNTGSAARPFRSVREPEGRTGRGVGEQGASQAVALERLLKLLESLVECPQERVEFDAQWA